MKRRFFSSFSLRAISGYIALACIILAACEKDEKEDNVLVFSVSGDITSKLNEFRSVLGTTLNTTPGVTGGRREINWDGIPDNLVGTKLPDDFFNPVGAGAPLARQRGLVYGGDDASNDFRVSKSNFSEINGNAAEEFSAFSGDKTFANVSSGLWPVGFRVAGENTEATIKGFGVVLSDVDLPNSTSIEFFDGTKSLGKFFAPVHDANSSFSFIGVYFKNVRATRVQIEHAGRLIDGAKDISDGGPLDLVVMDDFLYDEPVMK
jgi:hypothetical protein